MADVRPDPRRPIDPAINSPGREGLTGTAPANLYAPAFEREQITIAPDFAPADAQPAWRQDFPIDWPQDLYVERRDFMKFLVLTSAAFTVGQLWIGVQNWYRKRSGQPAMQRIASVDDLAVGGGGRLHLPGRTRTLPAGAADDERVRRLQPEVHAPVLRRDSPAGRRQLLLSLSRGTLRPADGRAHRRAAAPAADPDRARHPGTRHLRRRRRGADDMNASAKRPFSRDQRTTIVYGMLVFVLIVVILQLWLLTATMNAWLGGDDSVVWPAAAVSAGGLALNVGLLMYLGRIERTRRVGV